jgi:diguanylate cyclase
MKVLADLSAALELAGDFEAALRRYKDLVALERQARSIVAETRGRLSMQLADLEIAQLDAKDAREESQLYRDRSRELEREKRALEALAADLDRRANEDALTRLSNRHHLELELPRLFTDSVEQGLSLAIVVLDIDHFKQVNDNFGHAVGDTVLIQMADLLNRSRRAGDLIGRMGGEEFLIAFRGLDEPAAVEVCERLRRNVQGHDWDSLRPGLQVTVSLGVCARTNETDVYDIVEHADSRMYRAKRAGRNRVEWFSGLESAS